ncbi:ribosome maturation factor RimM [Gemmatimonadota bacterium]
MKREDLIEIGRVAKPWGVRGEVKIRVTTDIPGRFDGLEGVWLDNGREEPRWYRIESVKRLKGAVAVKLESVDSPEQAELLRDADVAVPESERAELGEDEFYIYELVGLKVFDPTGRLLGSLSRVYQGAANEVFEVTGAGGTMLVPAVKVFVKRVDLEAGEIVLDPPVMEESGSEAERGPGEDPA